MSTAKKPTVPSAWLKMLGYTTTSFLLVCCMATVALAGPLGMYSKMNNQNLLTFRLIE